MQGRIDPTFGRRDGRSRRMSIGVVVWWVFLEVLLTDERLTDVWKPVVAMKTTLMQ